ncbi:MAG TPA: tRNA (adenosine(37)-N6)-threonylcarbamoyltransferase complex dimerization subunit type 1 TsaB, partial [Thermodesulfobacteriota bacterium]|nr:tRNA (adenosine(37)-N6)-threonylcarbamoyltransferase complex dimerization subunit type 1 TsaB [Thermodesulfobacteriota bacterium]
MIVLALETATLAGSVALVDAGDGETGRRIIGENTLSNPETHSARLMPGIDRLLKEASLTIRDIGGIAVSIGPGSFTGLRIGVATAKGLAYALGIPVAGVPTLDALAATRPFSPDPVCPVLDARKKEVYAALFRCNGAGGLEKT